MAKLLRGLLYLVGILVILVVIAVVVIPLVVDPNDYRDKITQVVEEKTGRKLEIKGDLGLSVFPWLALEIGSTTLSNAQGFSAENFAAVENVQVRVKLLPLLRKKVEMDKIVLNGLSLNLEKNKAGQTNWDDLSAGSEKTEEATVEETASTGSPISELSIGGVEITDASVIWDDRSSDVKYTIAPFSLKTGAINPGKPVSIDMDMQLVGGAPVMKGGVAFDGVVNLSESMQQIQLKDVVLDVDLTGESLPGGQLKAALKTAANLDLEAQTLSTSQLILSTLGVVLEGDLAGQNIMEDGRIISGNFRLQPFSPKELLQTLDQAAPETSDPAALSKADASWALKLESDKLALSDFLLHLDDTTVQGNLNVAQFSKPAIRFDLSVDSIDADRYLAPASEAAPVPSTPATAAAGSAGAIPVDALRGLNLNGALKIGSLKAFQLRSKDIVMNVSAKGGKLRLHPASANMYEGSYKGDVRLDVRGKQPKISMNETISKVNIGPLLLDMTGKDTVTGITDAQFTLNGSGETPDQIKRSLNGEMSFSFSNGAVKGINVIRMIRKAKAVLKGKQYKGQEEPDKTDFSTMTATATVTNGVIQNNDLSAKSPLFRINGKGNADLGREAIDYLLTTTIVGSLEGEGGRDLGDLKGIPVPVEINGTFAKPRFELRLDEAIKQAAGEQIKQKVDEKKQELKDKAEKEIQEKLKKKLGDDLGGKLKGLFGK
jgi:AsmA protein